VPFQSTKSNRRSFDFAQDDKRKKKNKSRSFDYAQDDKQEWADDKQE
jgi:hypothetical protein